VTLTPRARLIAYLVAVHVLLAAAGIFVIRQSPLLLIAVEAVFVVSAAVGITLLRRTFSTFGYATAGAQLIRDREFTSKLLPTGQPEVDQLIDVYNRMSNSLRDERIRLQEQQHFLADMLRVSPAGVVILDFDRRVVSINPAGERLLGCTAAQACGARLDEIGTAVSRVLHALQPGHTSVIQTTSAQRLRGHHGTFLDRGFRRSFLLLEELTEELRQAERNAYEKLIRVMAHEVNNSVTASNSLLTSSLTYGAELSPESRGDFDQAIGIVIQRTGQLNRFMRSFADAFRLPAPVKHPERVLELLQSTARLVAARLDAPATTWLWHIDDPDLTVPMDRMQMEQAFLNVMQNAVEAQAGTITVRLVSRNGGRPTLRIEDCGHGFEAEVQANLFTPFFSTKPNGQGIGLTLVREILSAHGFDYSLHKDAGQPTTFTIVF
jgi:two-component system, NtrC family, nitrogen regulation sensor histidine kinase NtrY